MDVYFLFAISVLTTSHFFHFHIFPSYRLFFGSLRKEHLISGRPPLLFSLDLTIHFSLTMTQIGTFSTSVDVFC